jgi:hypothetical protein
MMTAEDELDLETRELCGDGSCTGVLGADGRCGECGRTFAEAEAALPARGEPGADELATEMDAVASDEEWQKRELCPDETCTGVIAEDGRCGQCGRVRAR